MTWEAIGQIWAFNIIVYGPWLFAYLYRRKNSVAMYFHKEVYLNCMWRGGVLRILRLLPGLLLVVATAAAMHMYFSSPSDNSRHYNNFMKKY